MALNTLEAWIASNLDWLSGWPREAAISGALVALAFGAAYVARLVWHRVLLPVARRTPTPLDTTLLTAAERPMTRAVTLLILYAAARRLAELPPLSGSLSGRILDGTFYALVVAAVTRLAVAAADGLSRWYLSDVASRTASALDEHFVPVIGKLVAVTAYFIAATVVLDHVGVNVTALVTTAGVASLALALAAQETLSNMFAGFTIMLDRSYRVGDRIQLPDGTTGDVQEIGLRATKILSFDNELIIVPNKEMASSRILNQNYPDLRVKVRVRVGVAYHADLDHARRVMLEACLSHPKVLKDPAPAVYFTDFGDSSLNLLAICWVADYRDRFSVLDELNMAVKKRFDQEGIEIPFPQRDVHIRTAPQTGYTLPAAHPPAAAPLPAGGDAMPRQKMTEADIQAALQGIPGWARQGDALVRTFEFGSFREAMAFVGQVAQLAEAANHHPDILVRYRKVTLTLSTHDAGGLTRHDFNLAERVSRLAGV